LDVYRVDELFAVTARLGGYFDANDRLLMSGQVQDERSPAAGRVGVARAAVSAVAAVVAFLDGIRLGSTISAVAVRFASIIANRIPGDVVRLWPRNHR
jgi:hypothetical protein